MTREVITELERQLAEAKRVYLRSHGWDMTFKTPGAVPLWVRGFDADRTIMVNMECAIQMTMTALDPDCQPNADSSE